MREQFERLLTGFSAFRERSQDAFVSQAARLSTLLNRFVELRARADASESRQAAADRERLGPLLTGYNEAVLRDRLLQEQTADDFNLLAVMQLTGKEIRHSMVLAWLLDHDLRRLGTHAQGNLGFRLFLAEFKLPGTYADCNYRVDREVRGDRSIVDIEVRCSGRFLIHIENKIWSQEGSEQTDREWSDIQRRATELGVAGSNIHALYFTPYGAAPMNPYFQAISWGKVVGVLEKFAERAKPADVKLFARHYARGLRRFIVVGDNEEVDDDEANPE